MNNRLVCPECKHSVENHFLDGCNCGWDGANPPCVCRRSYHHALTSANQRAAAIAYLRAWCKEYRWKHGEIWYPVHGTRGYAEYMFSVRVQVAALKAAGVL